MYLDKQKLRYIINRPTKKETLKNLSGRIILIVEGKIKLQKRMLSKKPKRKKEKTDKYIYKSKQALILW